MAALDEERLAAALDAAEQAKRRLAFLAEASNLAASSLDYDLTLAGVARLAVPMLADWCRVYIRDADGSVRRAAVAYADPARAEIANALLRFAPSATAPNSAVARALETGEAQLATDIPDEYVEAIAQDDAHLALLRRLDFRSSMVVPLRARGRVLGALAFFTGESGRHYGPEELAFAEEVAHSAALAVDNARLYAELAEAVRLRDHVLASAAHDLKTPLTAIILIAQLLERTASRIEGPFAERIIEQVARIDMNTSRMVRLIDELGGCRHFAGRAAS